MPDKPLNNDDEENLRMENELLRLKLKAELGADSYSTGNLDPILENAFLNQVMAFENNYAGSKRIKVFDLLGRPDFKQADLLSDEAIDAALLEITSLLTQKNMEIDFIGTYDSRTKYAFITGELFDHETDDLQIPGMVNHFIYEEFHPNHKMDIEDRALEFLSGWFKLDLEHCAFDENFVLSDKSTLNKKELTEKFRKIFDSYNAFTDYNYSIADISFELQDESGMGYAEGYTKYNAILENKEKVIIKGPFKLYFSYQYGWWCIFHLVFPGFEY